MRIEEEIQQKNFRSEYQRTTINLIYSSSWLLKKHRDFFHRFAITEQQYNVLRILKGQYPVAISTSEIKKRMLDMNSDSSRIVDRLAQKELISKRVSKSDKRLVDVQITPKGLDLLGQIDRYSDELDRIISNLTLEEARELNRLLDKMRN
jgi:DNA-binding MarR family transcriptional regulator